MQEWANKIVAPGRRHNTFLLRGVIQDAEDPAFVIAQLLLKQELMIPLEPAKKKRIGFHPWESNESASN